MKTISDILPFFLSELQVFYRENEIKSFAYISIKHILNMSKSDTIIHSKKILEEDQILRIKSSISSLKEYEPIQYIFNETEFYKREFYCMYGALIPRPETEELVDWIIRDNKETKKNYLDVGTGSGCIIISLCNNLKGNFTGIDVSRDALRVAISNNDRNETNVNFECVDVLNYEEDFSVSNLNDKYDVIVSNPPYVLNSEKEQMQKNVLDWEPHIALFVEDDDSFIFYNRIADRASKILNKKGLLYFEINERFGKEIIELLEKKGFVNIELKKDINDKDRMIKAMWK
tara:strand:+ start:19032 stop:19895 length:864 start_codon:yes stop_codon:yes gene_type:complete